MTSLVDQIVAAVLYEGYILYPYRPSVKNRQRWTFGGLCPRSYSEAHEGSDAWAMQTEFLVHGDCPVVHVEVRFLHLTARLVGELEHPLEDMPPAEPAFRLVERLQVGERLLQTWQEAVERKHLLPGLELANLTAGPGQSAIELPASRQLEPVRDPTGRIVAVLLREQQAVSGLVETSATVVAEQLYKMRVRVSNLTPLANAAGVDRDVALVHSLVSTNIVLSVRGGEFVSAIDPQEQCRQFASTCQNIGAWPVLVGEPGQKDTLLAAPIILYDHPQIARESAGDLFDGTEIDEILTLRILTLTDEEKRAAAALDERVRALLHRTENLDPAQLLQMHGKIRNPSPLPRGGTP